jgi:hypothetical protein
MEFYADKDATLFEGVKVDAMLLETFSRVSDSIRPFMEQTAPGLGSSRGRVLHWLLRHTY